MGKFFERVMFLLYTMVACAMIGGVLWLGAWFTGVNFGTQHISAQQAQMNIAVAERSLYFGYALRVALLLLVTFGGLACIYRFVYVPAVNDRERVYYDPATGMAPAVMRDVTPWLDKVRIALGNHELERKLFRHDSNLAIAPTNYIRMNGTLTVDAQLENGVTVEQQVKHAGGSWGVQNRVAGRSANGASRNPNRAMLEAEAGIYDNKAKLLESKLLESQGRLSEPIDIVLPPAVLPELSLDQAIKDSLGHPGRLVIGNSLDGTQRYEVDFTEEPFKLIGGKTRRGKTTTAAFQIVTAMLAWGWPVTVFEPSAKRDWAQGFAGGYINHHVVDADNAVAHLRMVEAEYTRRSEILKANNLVNWQDNPALCPPWVVVIEELGKLRDNLLALGKEDLAKFDGILKSLLRAAANTGLMILAVDQYPDRYPTSMRGQFGKIAFYMGGVGLGNIMESPKNHQLVNERGVFDVGIQDMQGEPVFFQAYHTKPYLAALLARVPRVKPLPLLTHEDCGNGAGTDGNDSGNASCSHSSPVVDSETPINGNGGNAGNGEGVGSGVKVLTPPSVLRAFLRSRVPGSATFCTLSLAQVAFAKGLLETFPAMTQAELRQELRAAMIAMRAMAGDKEPVGDMKSDASRLWHGFSVLGNPEKLRVDRPAMYEMAMEYRNERATKDHTTTAQNAD